MKKITKQIVSLLLLLSFLTTNVFFNLTAFAQQVSTVPSDQQNFLQMSEEEYKNYKKSLAPQVETKSISRLTTFSTNSAFLSASVQNTSQLIGNDFIEYFLEAVNNTEKGRFTIGARKGDPSNPNDDGKIMLYGHPRAWSSYTTVNIDGSYFIFNPSSFLYSGTTSLCQQVANEVYIVQELSIVKSATTPREDTVQIKYKIKNSSTGAKNIGLRIMLDTMLGSNDGAPFRVPGLGAVTNEIELSGDNIPEYYQAFDTLTNPTIITQGIFYTDKGNRPDRVQFAHWSNLYRTPWNYTVNPNVRFSNGTSYGGDSAVAIYWENEILLPNEEKEFVTYYGIGEFTQELRPPLAVSLTSVSEIQANENDYYPNPFTVTAYIMNNSNVQVNNVKAKIVLPDGLDIEEEAEKTIDSLKPGEERLVSWKVFVEPFTDETTLTYSVAVVADNVEGKVLSRTIKIPPHPAGDQFLYQTGIETIENGTSCLVGEPVNPAVGNFVTSSDDISIEGSNKIVFSRFYNSIDSYKGIFGNNWRYSFDFKLKKVGEKLRVFFNDGHAEDFVFNQDIGKYISIFDNKKFITKNQNDYILELNGEVKFYFNLDGQLIAIEDENSNKTTLVYEDGRLVKIESLIGYLTFHYNTDGYVTKVTDNNGRFVEYGYDGDRLIWFADVEGNRYRYEYDEKGRLTKIINPLGVSEVVNVYDEKGRVISQQTADGSLHTFVYDDVAHTTTYIQPNGAKIVYKKDGKYRIFEHEFEDGKVQYVFDDNNQIIGYIDKNNNSYRYEYDEKGNLIKEINPLGFVTQFEYDSRDNLIKIRNPDGTAITFEYDDKGNVILTRDEVGRETKVEYNEKGLPKRIIYPNGAVQELEYDEKGNVTKVKDPLGSITTYEYDTFNRLIGMIKPEGNKTVFSWTKAGYISSIKYPDNTSQEFEYDAKGNVTKIIDQLGRQTIYKYNEIGKLSEITDAVGRVTKFEYDNMWNLKKIIKPDGTFIEYSYDNLNRLVAVKDEEGFIVKYEYDPNGNVTRVVSGRGKETKYVYDALNRVIEEIDAKGRSTKFEYTYDGKIKRIIDAQGNVTEYEYNPAGELVAKKDAQGNIVKYSYNALGLISTETDEVGATTRYEYDLKGNLVKITFADGSTNRFEYDRNGNLKKYIDANGQVTEYYYDNCDRLVMTKDALGSTKRYEYTPTGKLSAIIDAKGNKTTFIYDAVDRLVEVISPDGAREIFVYDSNDNVIEIHKFMGVTKETIERMNKTKGEKYSEQLKEIVIKYKYNKRGQLVSEQDALGNVKVYTYDADGNLIESVDKNGNTTKYEYDAVNNLSKITYADGKTVEFKYDNLDRLVEVNDWLGSKKYEYDVLSRVTKVVDYKGRAFEYSYTKRGEKAAIKYPNGRLVQYEYDVVGRLIKVTTDGKETKYKYDAKGNLIEKILPNGVRSVYEYDAVSQLTRLANYGSKSKILSEILYKYDPNGNKIYAEKRINEREIGKLAGITEGKVYYEYDTRNQLIKVKRENGFEERYFYDTLGNRVRKEEYAGRILANVIDYKYDDEQRLYEIKATGLIDCIKLPEIKMEYDSEGNLISIKSGRTEIIRNTFDVRGRLTKVNTIWGIESIYTYDSSDKRVNKIVELSKFSKDILRKYLNDGRVSRIQERCEELINNKRYRAEYEYVYDETSESDDLVAINTNYGVDEEYIYGNGIIGAQVKERGKLYSYYYLTDDLFSPQIIVDATGKVEGYRAYSEFGEKVVEIGKIRGLDVVGFTGYKEDKESGYLYAAARYYLPQVGRYISKDRIFGEIAELTSQNPYVYCLNNPLIYVDPSGELSVKQSILLIQGLGLGLWEVAREQLKALGDIISFRFIGAFIDIAKALPKLLNSDVIKELLKSLYDRYVEPVEYVIKHTREVFSGRTCNEEVKEYGKKLGIVVGTIVATVADIILGKKAIELGAKLIQKLGNISKRVKGLIWKVAEAAPKKRITLEYLIETAKFVEKKKSTGLYIYEKSGGFENALRDFYNLEPKNVKIIEGTYKGDIQITYVGDLKDGEKVIVRLKSDEGRPTLEIQKFSEISNRCKPKIKIRYNDN